MIMPAQVTWQHFILPPLFFFICLSTYLPVCLSACLYLSACLCLILLMFYFLKKGLFFWAGDRCSKLLVDWSIDLIMHWIEWLDWCLEIFIGIFLSVLDIWNVFITVCIVWRLAYLFLGFTLSCLRTCHCFVGLMALHSDWPVVGGQGSWLDAIMSYFCYIKKNNWP